MGNEILGICGILVCLCFCGALVSVDWQMVLTGDESQVIVDVPDSPEIPGDPEKSSDFVDITVNVSSISWGVLKPGENASFAVLVNNIGNVDVELFVQAVNWEPVDAQQYMSLVWEEGSAVVKSGSSVVVHLVLLVDPKIEGITDFSFDVFISAVQF